MFYLLSIFNGIFYIIITACYYYIPIYLYTSKSINVWQVSILLFVMFVSAIIGNMPNIVSLLSIRFTVIISTLILILVLYSILITNQWIILLLILILFGFVKENISSNIDSLITQNFLQDNFGIWRLHKALFEFIGVFTSSYIISTYNYNEWFYIIINLCFILTILSLFLPNIATKTNIPYEIPKVAWPIILLIFIVYMQIGAQYSTIGIFAIKNLSLSLHDIGTYISFKYLFVGITMFILYYLKVNYKYLLTYGLLISGVALFLSAYTNLFIYSFIYRLIYSCAEGALLLGLLETVLVLADKYEINNLNIFTIISIFGVAIGSAVFFLIGYYYGFQNAIMINGIIMLFFAYPTKSINI